MNKGQKTDSAKRVVVTGIGMVTPLESAKKNSARGFFPAKPPLLKSNHLTPVHLARIWARKLPIFRRGILFP